MIGRAATPLAFAVLICGAAAAADTPPTTYALVVTNNRSLDPSRPDLQYADDDGAKYAELFAEVGGEDRVVLLTAFDAASAALHPIWAPRARPPTKVELQKAIRELAGRLEVDRAAGRATVVLVVFAGHGDLDRGQGFVELEDGRLTADELERDIIAALPAQRVHLLLDSCNSYFMLNPRKPGGKRWQTQSDASAGLLARHPHVGALVSTSAEAVTYEWSELQSGIFSYEVRSGLRGAADVDGDQRITYAELAAFIAVANRPVLNDLYRPKVFARSPSLDKDGTLLDVRAVTSQRVRIGAPRDRRLTVRDGLGIRVVDLHKEDGTSLELILPRSRSDLRVSEATRAPGGSQARPTLSSRALPSTDDGPTDLDALTAVADPLAQRGEAPIFRNLFDQPFGRTAFAKEAAEVLAPKPEYVPQGITLRDTLRLRQHLTFAADGNRLQGRTAAVALATVGVGVAGSTFLPGRPGNEPAGSSKALLRGTGVAMVMGAALIAFIPGPEQRLLNEYLTLDLSTEAARSKSVLLMESRFEQDAVDTARQRKTFGWVSVGLGVLGGAATAYVLSLPGPTSGSGLEQAIFTSSSLFLIGAGLFSVFGDEYPVERAWRFYVEDADLALRNAPATTNISSVKLMPVLGVGSRSSPYVGISGVF